MTAPVIERGPGSRVGRRRARARRRMWSLVLVLALAGGGIGGVVAWRHFRHSRAVVSNATPADQDVTLLVLTKHDVASTRADSLTLFGVSRSGGDPVTLFIPTGTLLQVPGSLGYARIGDASTRTPFLQRIAVENLLGVSIDATVTMDDLTLGQIIDSLGGLNIDVEEDVYEHTGPGTRAPEFDRGPQHMDAGTALTYMNDIGDGGTELDRFVRQQKAWDALLAAGAARIASAIARIDQASLDREQAAVLTRTLGTMADRRASARYDDVSVTSVISTGTDEAYKIDRANLDVLVRRDFAASMLNPSLDVSARPRVDVRNGVGAPGLGERVGALLIEGGLQLVTGGNAPTFDNASTRIVVYGHDDASLALGRRIRTLLGVGRIEVGTNGQTVVDATIIVGRDFGKRT